MQSSRSRLNSQMPLSQGLGCSWEAQGKVCYDGSFWACRHSHHTATAWPWAGLVVGTMGRAGGGRHGQGWWWAPWAGVVVGAMGRGGGGRNKSTGQPSGGALSASSMAAVAAAAGGQSQSPAHGLQQVGMPRSSCQMWWQEEGSRHAVTRAYLAALVCGL
jgi:hypothetical protein